MIKNTYGDINAKYFGVGDTKYFLSDIKRDDSNNGNTKGGDTKCGDKTFSSGDTTFGSSDTNIGLQYKTWFTTHKDIWFHNDIIFGLRHTNMFELMLH